MAPWTSRFMDGLITRLLSAISLAIGVAAWAAREGTFSEEGPSVPRATTFNPLSSIRGRPYRSTSYNTEYNNTTRLTYHIDCRALSPSLYELDANM